MPARQSFQVEEPPASTVGEPAPARRANRKVAGAAGGVALALVVGAVALSSRGGGGGDRGKPQAAEKVIWAYHDGELSDFQRLCKETIEQHKGEFDFQLLSKGNVFQHISREDLPTDWDALKPRYQKDSVINALLARHGGVAMDINTVMFRGLGKWWADSIADKDAAFKGFYYKSRAEAATWFMMAGTDSMMQKAVAEQRMRSGDEPAGCMAREKKDEHCYGSSVISWALCSRQSEYCQCYFGETEGCQLTKLAGEDRKHEGPVHVLADPRKSVQSPLLPNTVPKEEAWKPLASTAQNAEHFASFKQRLHGDTMPFITLQAPGEAAGKSREELLADKDTFFYQWLCSAKHPDTDADAC